MPPKQAKRVVGLFAGIGGLEQGLKKAGYESSMLCEIDPVAQTVLRAQFPSAEIVDDVRDIRALRDVDLLTAGFPCQDLSSVGKKKGIEGARSGLVDEIFRILEVSSIDWVVVENVRFMLHLNKGEAMSRVVEGFERLGYRWAYRVVNSLSFGVPQRRHRVFFVASRTGDPRNVLLSDEGGLDASADKITLDRPIGFYWTEGTYATGLCQDAIPPLKAGSTIGIPSAPAILFPDGMVGVPALGDAERLQGFEDGWTSAAEAVAKASFRWRLLGNAVTVPVAGWVGSRLRRPKSYDCSHDIPIKGKWPNAAWSMGDGRYASNRSEFPLSGAPASLSDFLRHDVTPLSHRAVTGFLQRARRGGLKFPEGFLDRLSEYSQRL